MVYATGYGSMEGWAARCLSPDIAARVGKVWGLGSDTVQDPGPWQGELRNMWKPTARLLAGELVVARGADGGDRRLDVGGDCGIGGHRRSPRLGLGTDQGSSTRRPGASSAGSATACP